MQNQTIPTTDFIKPVFFTPAKDHVVPSIIDESIKRRDGVYVGRYSGETIEQLSVRYPGAQLGELHTVIAEKEAMLISAPAEISDETFEQALEVLPPEDYAGNNTSCSFKCCEYLDGRITQICALVDGKYYAFNDVHTIKHDQIVEKIRKHVQLTELNRAPAKTVTQ